jgi:hypothetical protein
MKSFDDFRNNWLTPQKRRRIEAAVFEPNKRIEK